MQTSIAGLAHSNLPTGIAFESSVGGTARRAPLIERNVAIAVAPVRHAVSCISGWSGVGLLDVRRAYRQPVEVRSQKLATPEYERRRADEDQLFQRDGPRHGRSEPSRQRKHRASPSELHPSHGARDRT